MWIYEITIKTLNLNKLSTNNKLNKLLVYSEIIELRKPFDRFIKQNNFHKEKKIFFVKYIKRYQKKDL